MLRRAPLSAVSPKRAAERNEYDRAVQRAFAFTSPQPSNKIRRLPRGAPIPSNPPRRYRTSDGYFVWRWRVGTREYIEVLEHRVRDGHVVDAETVHHHDHVRHNNSRSNLSPISASEHARIHHRRTTDRKAAVAMYASGMTTVAIAAELGTYCGNISRILRAEGVTIRPSWKRTPVDEAELERLGRLPMPWGAIARELRLTRAIVDRRLRELGVPPYPAGNPELRRRGQERRT